MTADDLDRILASEEPLAGAGVALAGAYLLVRLTLGFTGARR